jgi:hypothetical protein
VVGAQLGELRGARPGAAQAAAVLAAGERELAPPRCQVGGGGPVARGERVGARDGDHGIVGLARLARGRGAAFGRDVAVRWCLNGQRLAGALSGRERGGDRGGEHRGEREQQARALHGFRRVS